MTIPVNLEVLAKNAWRGVKRGDIIIVIDVFRCCSTIITALHNGAKGILPVKTVKEAIKIHKENRDWLLAGERRAHKPKGFHLGNSPLEFVREKVKGKIIIITTTDGTKALRNASGAEVILIGALLNASSVAECAVRIAQEKGKGITIVASGIKGRVSLEDFLCAGLIIESMEHFDVSFSDSARCALLASKGAGNRLSDIVQESGHANYLKSIGLMEDVKYCSQVNLYPLVPRVGERGIITLENSL